MAFNPNGGYTPEQQQLFQPYQIGSKGMKPVKKQGGASKFFLGEKEQFQRSPLHTPQGMQALEQLLATGLGNLQNPQAGFQPIAENAQRQFQTQTIPGLAERFTNLGGSDTRGSSDFAGMLGGAGADLQSQLASMASQYGLQNQQNALSQLQTGLQPQFETQHKNRGSGFFENLLNQFAGPGLQSAAQSFGSQYGQYGGTTNAPIAGQNVVGQYSPTGQPGGGNMASYVTKLLPYLL